MIPARRIPVLSAAAGIILMLAAACSHDPFPLWSGFRHVGEDGWNSMETLDFTPEAGVMAPEGIARAAIAIRHNRELPYSSLRIQIEQSDSTGVLSTDTVTMLLADSEGRWIGHKTNALTETVDTLPFPIRLTPGYTISLTPAARAEVIPGIVNVGIILIDPGHGRRDIKTDIPGIKDLRL